MASIPTPTTSKQSIVLAPPSSRMDEEDKIGYDTDLSAEDMDIEINTDTSTLSTADKKKLQHMTEFHIEYQHVFGEGASIRTIMKRISHLNPPMPKAVCEEEMQNIQLDNNEVIIEYITDSQGNKVKKAVPEENFAKERERMIDSYSESISLEDDPSNERTIAMDSNSSVAAILKETLCEWEADPKGIEATLHQISSILQSTAEGYPALASHMSQVMPYELPQIVAQIPPPPMDVPLPIRKALLIDG